MPNAHSRVLIAFDKFKDSLTAERACEITGAAISRKHPNWTVDLCPFTDGGDGFERLLTAAVGGRLVEHEVEGPLLQKTPSQFGIVSLGAIPKEAQLALGWSDLPGDSTIAVIGMASASGLAQLQPDERDPWKTTSRGTGELIAAAMLSGAKGVVLGLGGSATNDLGLGALEALGFRFLDAQGKPVSPPIPSEWPRIRAIAVGALPLPFIRIACDVDNPLLGARGAATVFGPQKGLKADDHARMEAESARLSILLCEACGQPLERRDEPGSGAAGGAGFGLRVGARADLVSGSDLVAAWVGLEHRMANADVVITGEGRFDLSSLDGKGPAVLAKRAQALGKEVHIFAGAVSVASAGERISLHAISPPGLPLPDALRQAPDNLARTVESVF